LTLRKEGIVSEPSKERKSLEQKELGGRRGDGIMVPCAENGREKNGLPLHKEGFLPGKEVNQRGGLTDIVNRRRGAWLMARQKKETLSFNGGKLEAEGNCFLQISQGKGPSRKRGCALLQKMGW